MGLPFPFICVVALFENALFEAWGILFEIGVVLLKIGVVPFKIGVVLFKIGVAPFVFGVIPFRFGFILFGFGDVLFGLGNVLFGHGVVIFKNLGTHRSCAVMGSALFRHALFEFGGVLFGPEYGAIGVLCLWAGLNSLLLGLSCVLLGILCVPCSCCLLCSVSLVKFTGRVSLLFPITPVKLGCCWSPDQVPCVGSWPLC